MIWIIIIAIVVIIAFKMGSTSGKVLGEVKSSGGMRTKYATLVSMLLKWNKDCRVLVETRTYLRIGASNSGGTNLFHIQQSTGNKVLIQFEDINDPIYPDFQLNWTFPDNMDQETMVTIIARDTHNKTLSF